ncbi:nucleoside monophosphate kinase [Candidatus Saccharibacteria bacterium]|nr:nucleoside monophosphate kinase [Candidatus Saccharibacteria bacterium]
MKDKLSIIKSWLGTGSVNIFGLPMSGKDAQGQKLAELLGAKFLSSGDIIRQKEAEARQDYSSEGNLIPTDVFYAWVLPYFYEPAIKDQPLVLSSIGRWFGEEDQVLAETAKSGHKIKAVILLDLSVADVESRFEAAKILGDRGNRADDSTFAIMQYRIEEFSAKTLPVIQHYNDLGLLLRVNGDQPRDAVTAEIIEKLYERASEEVA